jgi:subtilisin family serine protease
VWSGVSITNPALPKIMWCAKDNSVQRIYYGTEGVSPNRTFRVRQEGTSSTSGTLGYPTMVCEWTFYENAPSQIDLQVGVNSAKTTGGGFTTTQLNAWGFISGQRIPARVSACDDDIEDLYDEGIIMVGAAGNGRWKHDVPGGVDWNNTFEMATRYPASVLQPYYYMRGTSPTANDTLASGTHDLPAICVGAVDTIQIDQKVLFSDCGAGVDLFAPGTYIMSALPSGVADSRNASFFNGKFSGTSMASPQVCGVLACALEIYPDMNQERAKAYITAIAKSGQLTATSGGPTDGQDLQGAPNLYLFYKKERETSGNVFPKINYKPRPTTGSVYPRPRIKRTL